MSILVVGGDRFTYCLPCTPKYETVVVDNMKKGHAESVPGEIS
jgi:hypothetical protein